MSAEHAVLGGRLDPSARTLGVAVGDLVLITVLITTGVVQHHGVAYVTTFPLAALETAVPFYVGWALAAVVAGAYAKDALATPRRAAIAAGGAWIVAAAIGALLRGTAVFSGGFDVVFLAVITGVGLVVLVPWRIVASFVTSRRTDPTLG